jgi:transcriptional regulator with XRE-family HTH domain
MGKYSKIIGQRIREERLKRNLTQEQLAEIADLSPGHLGHIERGDKGINIDKIVLFAQIFNITVNDLLQIETFKSKGTTEELEALETLLYDMNDKQINFIIETVKLYKKSL